MARKARGLGLFTLGAAIAALVAACDQSGFEGPVVDEDEVSDSPGVGGDTWGQREITCEADSDCGEEESCVDGVCQVSACQEEAYASAPPLGENQAFYSNREILAADQVDGDGAYFVDGYEATESALSDSDWGPLNTGSREIIDVAGGHFSPGDREAVAVAVEGSTEIRVEDRGSLTELNVGFEPVALAAGDVDGDGLDDIIVLGQDDAYGLCKLEEGQCINAPIEGGGAGIDAAAGDIDGDGYDEAVFLLDRGGDGTLVTWNAHYEETGEEEFYSTTPSLGHRDSSFRRIVAGDLSGDGIAEVGAIHSRHLTYNDRVKIFRDDSAELARVGNVNLNTQSSTDVAIADLNMSGDNELVVLRGGSSVDVYRGDDEPGSLSFAFDAPLAETGSASRIATADVSGDSPRAYRVSGPETVPGPVVPLIAVNFPPYQEDQADGLPSVMVGDTENTSETYTDSVSLSTGVQVGAEVDIFGALGGGAQAAVERSMSRAESQGRSETIGNRFVFRPDVEDFGNRYGIVVVSAGCFHHYTYEVSDPAGALSTAAHGEEIVGVVPVDGQSTIWTTHRYNALASEYDALPEVEFNTEIGNLDTYPQERQHLDGSPLPPEELVFEDLPQYLASEAGRTGWWLSYQDTEAVQRSTSTSVSVMTSLSAGASVQTNVSSSMGSAYSISVGEQYLFGGNIPPIDVDSGSPNDDYEDRAYSFSPYVYEKTYEDPDGAEAGFYVLDFTVGE